MKHPNMSSTDADPRSCLVTTWVSQASAKQRCGRTGRVFEGVRRPRAVSSAVSGCWEGLLSGKIKGNPHKILVLWYLYIYIYVYRYILLYILLLLLWLLLLWLLLLYYIYIYICFFCFKWFSKSPCLITIWWYINNGFLIMFSECPRRWKSRQLDVLAE